MRPRLRLPWWTAPIILFVGLVAGGLLAPDAHADPSIDANTVCAALEHTPTVDGVTRVIGDTVKDTGLEPSVAFQAVTIAVALKCPDLFPVLRKFTEAYQPAPEFRQGYIA
jgi:hypothetical protein